MTMMALQKSAPEIKQNVDVRSASAVRSDGEESTNGASSVVPSSHSCSYSFKYLISENKFEIVIVQTPVGDGYWVPPSDEREKSGQSSRRTRNSRQ